MIGVLMPSSAPRFKTSLQIVHLPPVSIYATLDAALVADYVVLLLSSEVEVEEEGERVLRCLQGVVGAQVVAAVQVSRGRRARGEERSDEARARRPEM
jgi:hypothetical protein